MLRYMWPVLVLGLSARAATPTAAALKTANMCKTPQKDLVVKNNALLTTIFPDAGADKIIKLLMQQVCNGSTLKEVGSNFLSTMQKGADDATYKKISQKIAPFATCLTMKGCSISQAFDFVGIGFQAALAKFFKGAKASVAKWTKAKSCTVAAMYTAMGKNICPVYTASLVIDEIYKAFGSNKGWQCIPANLSPNVLNFTRYNTHV